MSEKCVETLTLSDGLKIEIWDQSRVIAGDRWLVRLEGRIDVPLRIEYFDALPEKERLIPILQKALGPTLPYRSVSEQHFVAKDLKDHVFQQFLDRFKRDVLPYLRHPDFQRRFALTRYRDLRNRDPRLFLKRDSHGPNQRTFSTI